MPRIFRGPCTAGTCRWGRSQELLDKIEAARQEVQTMQEELPMLKAQIQAISDRNDFIEDCIAEMATVVYGE